ncbi:serine/threonine-protein kinase [Catenulispora rubra]|uniref:serine/threonine-protein kinase n=1 Tax=Catenulispora rubra TaxID=280293 RepID=UPI0018927319|nr:serine/threonine-protein kinase [Catenulispora rubra]
MRSGSGEPPQISGYSPIRDLAKGGHATVYLYRQVGTGRQVAVKVLEALGPEATTRRRTGEVEAMAQFDGHPHIVRIIDAPPAADGRRILIMPYYPGGDLLTRVKLGGPLPVAEAVRVGIQIAGALAKVHETDFVHCDVKPANILINEHGYHLSDFGIVGTRSGTRTSSEFNVSVPWSPRETLAGEAATVQSDLYSLGATLWHVLKGRSPFHDPGGANSVDEIEQRIMTRTAPALALPGGPRELDQLVTALLAPRPASRPGSAATVCARLTAIGERLGGHRSEPGPDATQRRGDAGRFRPGDRPEDPSSKTSLRPGPPSHLISDPDRTKIKVTEPEPVERPIRTGARRNRIAAGAAAVLVCGAVITASVLAGGGHGNPAPSASGTGDSAPGGAGLVGEDLPPGMPAVTAARPNPAALHFTWNYSAAQASDTFQWQTSDGSRHGVTRTAALDLPDPAGTRLCVQVKVVRADGSDAQPDWSPEGCGS